jgi:hypothetical protein
MNLVACRTSYRDTLHATNSLVAYRVAHCWTLQTTLQTGRFPSKIGRFRQLSGNRFAAYRATADAASVHRHFALFRKISRRYTGGSPARGAPFVGAALFFKSEHGKEKFWIHESRTQNNVHARTDEAAV